MVVGLLAGLAGAPVAAQDAGSRGRLDPVVVTATRFDERASDLSFGVSVLTADELRAAGVATVNEALMKLLGVPGHLDAFGGADYGLDLRGFGATADSNQVVVVDGVRISEADLAGTRLAGIAIDAVDRIEVIRGPAAVWYGEGASGGAIVIHTKAGRGMARPSSAEVYAAAASDGLRELRSTATLAGGGFALDVAANRRESDNQRDNFHSRADGASATGQWHNAWLRAGVRVAADDLDAGLPGALTAAQYEADPRQTTTPSDHATLKNRSHGVFGDATLGDWQVAIDAGWRDKSLASDNAGFVYDYDIAARSVALRARHEGRFGALSNRFTAGLDDARWTRTVHGAFGALARQHAQGVYLRDELTLAGATRLSAGARVERIDKSNSDAAAAVDARPHAWEVGIVQPVGAGVSLFGRYGRSYRLANVDEFGYTAPSRTLAPQTARDAEVGMRWTGTAGRAELRVYRSALRDEIGFDPAAIGPYGFAGANVNFDATRREGVEFEASHAVGATAHIRLNAALRRARFEAGPYRGKDVPLTPRHSVALRADWIPRPGHRIDGGVTRVGAQHPDFDNACTMPAYTTADLRYAVTWGRAEWALRVDNLADAKYYTQAYACESGRVGSIYPEAGRTLAASLRWHF